MSLSKMSATPAKRKCPRCQCKLGKINDTPCCISAYCPAYRKPIETHTSESTPNAQQPRQALRQSTAVAPSAPASPPHPTPAAAAGLTTFRPHTPATPNVASITQLTQQPNPTADEVEALLSQTQHSQNSQHGNRTVKLLYDGGFRKKVAKAAWAWWISWQQYDCGSIAACNSATPELQSALAAHQEAVKQVAQARAHKRLVPNFTFQGDCQWIQETLSSFDETTTETDMADLSFSDVWKKIWQQQRQLRNQCPLAPVYTWVPRRYNKPPDELCNAVMDGRDPIHVDPVEPEAALHQIAAADIANTITEAATRHRYATWRSLPQHQLQLWRTLVHQLMEFGETSDGNPIFWQLAPIIFLRRRTSPTIAHLTQHLTACVNDEEYRNSTILKFCYNTQEDDPQSFRAVTAVERAQRLCALGSERKALLSLSTEEQRVEPTPQVLDELRKLFPHRKAELPQIPPDCTAPPHALALITPRKFLRVLRFRTSRATAPGFDGWTRELLIPVVNSRNHYGRDMFFALVLAVIGGNADAALISFMRKGVLFALRKPNGKHRPIVISSFVLRLAWKLALDCTPFLSTLHASQRFSKFACQQAIARLVDGVLDGKTAISLDASNAFGEIKRAVILQRLIDNPSLHLLLPMFRSFYCEAFAAVAHNSSSGDSHTIAIEEGVIQGCAAGAILFMIGLAVALTSIPASVQTLAAADDIALLHELSQPLIECFNTLVEALADIGITINCTKTATIGPNAAEVEEVTGLTTTDKLDYLGAFVTSSDDVQIKLDDIRRKYITKMQGLARHFPRSSDDLSDDEDAMAQPRLTCQVAFLLLRHLNFSMRYLMFNTRPACTNHLAGVLDVWAKQKLATLLDVDSNTIPQAVYEQCFLAESDGGFGILEWTTSKEKLHTAQRRAFHPCAADESHAFIKAFLDERARKFYNETYDRSTRPKPSVQRQIFNDAILPWLRIRPADQLLCLHDAQWRTAARMRLNIPVTSVAPCAESKHKSQNDHVFGCCACHGGLWFARHQRLLRALIRSLYDHAIYASASAISQLTNERREKGPDALVLCDSQTYAIDTSVTHQSATSKAPMTENRFLRKNQTHAEFSNKTSWKTQPVVYSSLGHPCSRTVSWLRTVAKSAHTYGFVRRTIAATTIAVLRGNADLVQRLEARAAVNEISPNDVHT